MSTTYFAKWKKARVLNAEEKKLVGEYTEIIGSIYYQANSNYIYSNHYSDVSIKGTGAMEVYYFYADGRFKKFQAGVGSSYTRIYRETGNWVVTAPNTISLTNIIGNHSSDDAWPNYVNKALPNEKLYYVKGVYKGDEGYYFESSSSTTLNKLQENIQNGIGTAFIYKKTK